MDETEISFVNQEIPKAGYVNWKKRSWWQVTDVTWWDRCRCKHVLPTRLDQVANAQWWEKVRREIHWAYKNCISSVTYLKTSNPNFYFAFQHDKGNQMDTQINPQWSFTVSNMSQWQGAELLDQTTSDKETKLCWFSENATGLLRIDDEYLPV